MNKFKRRDFRHLAAIPIAAGLVSFGCLTAANATPNDKPKAGTPSHHQHDAPWLLHGLSEIKNFRLRLERLESAVTALQAKGSPSVPGDLEQRINTLQSSINTLQTLLPANLDQRINTLESNIDTLQARLPANLDQRLTALESEIDSLQVNLPGMEQRLTAFGSEIDALQVSLPGMEQRLRKLESDSGEVQALTLPVDVDVNCASGDSIGAVLATYANGLAPLTIRFTGICNEAVAILRGNVALIGETDATIQTTPSTAYGVEVTNGAVNVSVSDLRIVGGARAASVSNGAQAVFSNVEVQESNLAMVSADNGTMRIKSSILHNNTWGAYATRGGVIAIDNSTVESNVTGGVADSGGVLDLSASRVQGNTDGLIINKTSSLAFSGDVSTITGNFRGMGCKANTGYVVSGAAPSVTGNSGYNNSGCTP